ncbi:nitrite/sulfite reductase domain-containing protein [Methanofollis fontis]|uniref:Sulfite reductase, assimilatory-type n=1 Tax=Methanofollis fontis TaxID=2052832 RepID=A0A483CQN3_9EURY|nr:NAD(P)/FAD-dependent oxidoreductase [Methanofollis fontis]TAJ45423.1 sulfite reductase, assimilatory-type [Methanofollis fontis]
MENGSLRGIRQRDGSYALFLRVPGGVLGPEDLEHIGRVAREHDVPLVKVTSGQRLALIGVSEEDIPAIRADIGCGEGAAAGPGLCFVQACPGSLACPHGVQDALSLALALEEIHRERAFPAKVKIGVSGCPRCCAGSYVRDVGVVGTGSGWTVTFGGNAGGRPRIGDVVAEGLDRSAAVETVACLLDRYEEGARPGERTARFAERCGCGRTAEQDTNRQER